MEGHFIHLFIDCSPFLFSHNFTVFSFLTSDACEDSLCFSPSFPTPTFPFHSYVLLHEMEESRHWVPSINFERLLCYFAKGAAPTLLSLSLLSALLCLQMGHLSIPRLPWAGNLGRVPDVCSFSKVLLLVTYFLLKTTCNCILMWNSTTPLQAPCVGVYANDRTRNEPLVGLGFFGGFFFHVFSIHLFSLINWTSVSWK